MQNRFKFPEIFRCLIPLPNLAKFDRFMSDPKVTFVLCLYHMLLTFLLFKTYLIFFSCDGLHPSRSGVYLLVINNRNYHYNNFVL